VLGAVMVEYAGPGFPSDENASAGVRLLPPADPPASRVDHADMAAGEVRTVYDPEREAQGSHPGPSR
jgi:hypothetical protein